MYGAQRQQERRCCARANILNEMREMVMVELGSQTGLLLDLSAVGAAIQAVYPTPLRARLNVKFRLPYSGDLIETNCEVAWVDDARRTGVKFVHLADTTRSRLEAWLATHSGEAKPLPEAPLLSEMPSFPSAEERVFPAAEVPRPAAAGPDAVSTGAPDARTEAEKGISATSARYSTDRAVRCEQCGQVNPPEYRYCGTCGKRLEPASVPAAPAPVRPAEREEPRSRAHAREGISGPSFLGLNAPAEERGGYLLDYERPSRWRGVALLVILAMVGGLIWMQWRSTLKVQIAKISTMARQSSQPAPVPSPAEPDVSVTEPSPPAAGTGTSGETTGAPKADITVTPAPAEEQTSRPEKKAAAEPEPQASTGEKHSAEPEELDQDATSAPNRVRPAARPQDESLLLLAQKYLHGRGVPENCEQGLIYLRAAQSRSAKARSQLGALYATGHCVPQDRVEAYRWFTSALALDPHNVWLDRQRNILFTQMTSRERQRAR